MAVTMTFRGTTIWSDAGDGIGQPSWVASPGVERLVEVPLVAADGVILKALGKGAGTLSVSFRRRFSNISTADSARAALAALADGVTGSATFTNRTTIANCALRQVAMGDTIPTLTPGGTIKFDAMFELDFIVTR